jgi:FemAB-related protein (PEP-CTERM system-associated)
MAVQNRDEIVYRKAVGTFQGEGATKMLATALEPSSTIKVCCYEDEAQDKWDNYVYQHPHGSLFHLSSWKRVIEKAFGFEPRYLVAKSQEGIRGVLPLFLLRNFIQGRVLISTPFAVYGGICASDEKARSELCRVACQMAKEEKVQYLELRERWSHSDPSLHTKQLYATFDRELPSSADLLLQGFPRDTRYMIRKAQKSGLCALGDNQQVHTFYEIYASSVRYLGTPVFAEEFFRIILEEFGPQCEITSVWHGKQPVAGVLSFRFRDWILPYYAGSLPQGRHLAANNFMYWAVMKQALESGLRFFDFGRSKLGTGAYAFKTQWGMREHPLPYQYYLVRRKNMPNFSPANPRFGVAASFWKRLPLAVTKAIGPTAVRLFP